MPDLVIVNSGVANLASICSAFRRLGTSVVVTDDPSVVAAARRVVLPGVGAFGAGLAALRAGGGGGGGGLDRAIAETVARGTPLLGVCLGMQMLCEGSEETSAVPGLGLIAGACRRLPDHVRVPHLGWNAVTAVSRVGLVDSGVAAFANSYALREAPPGWTPTWPRRPKGGPRRSRRWRACARASAFPLPSVAGCGAWTTRAASSPRVPTR